MKKGHHHSTYQCYIIKLLQYAILKIFKCLKPESVGFIWNNFSVLLFCQLTSPSQTFNSKIIISNQKKYSIYKTTHIFTYVLNPWFERLDWWFEILLIQVRGMNVTPFLMLFATQYNLNLISLSLFKISIIQFFK